MVPKEMFRVDQFAVDGVVLLADATGDARGAVHTRPEVVEFILDLVGWRAGEIQRSFRFLEPSAGHADFLAPAVQRLFESLPEASLAELEPMILAVEVNLDAVAICRSRVEAIAASAGRSPREARQLSSAWVRHADFLTLPLEANFSHVVGNPPYVRLEALPKPLLKLYRSLWNSLYDRADLYVAFIQKSLGLLSPEGRIGFICADRWMRNRYGKVLRQHVSDGFHLEVNVDFTNCPAFLSEVDAYPSVFTIRRGKGVLTRTCRRPEIRREVLRELAVQLTHETASPDVSVCVGSSMATIPGY